MRSIQCSAILLVLALVGCLDPTKQAPPPPQVSLTQQAVTSCQDSCDCVFGEDCVNHVCELQFGPWPPCFCGARDCPAGQVCSRGQCSAACVDNCDCERFFHCEAGQCLQDFGPYPACECARRDCAAGQSCPHGVCEGGGGGGGGGGGPGGPGGGQN